MAEANRIEWIDRMRGLAILSVVVQHMTYSFGNEFIYHKLIGICNMGIFFFISGFILNETCKIKNLNDVFRFYLKKVIQLIVPLVVWGLIVKNYFFHIGEWRIISVNDVIALWKNPGLWFLLTLFGYMLYFGLYRYMLARKRSLLAVVFLSIAFWLGGGGILVVLWKQTGDFHLATLYLPYFVFGVLMSEFKKIDILKKQSVQTTSLLVTFLLTTLFVSGATSVLNIASKLLVTFSMIAIVFYLCSTFEWNKKVDGFVQLCGMNSLAIYCAHWSFTRLTIDKPCLPNNELIALSICVLAACITSYGCILLKKMIGKYPLFDCLLFGKMPQSKHEL